MSTLKDISIKGFFNSKNYAIIGASSKAGSLGNIICENYKRLFKGDTYYVNPKGGKMYGQPVYKSPMEIPTTIESAVIIVAAQYAVKAAEQCMKKGAKHLIVIPGGFNETKTDEGRQKQSELVRLANEYQCRIIGPNCMGVYDPLCIDTLFVGEEGLSKPGPGPVGIFSQSGAIASAFLNELAGRYNDNWISKFISFGNACDVNEMDILRYYAHDESVKQVWAYLEGFRNGVDFMHTVKEMTQRKPMILIKSNRSASGAKASASHSASLAANDSVCDQLLAASGVIRCDEWNDMFNIGRIVRYQGMPKSKKLAIVTDAGGFGVLIADAVDRYGLQLADFDSSTVKQFRGTFPPYYQCANPMDITGSASTRDLIEATRLALQDPNIDSVVMGLQPIAPGFADPEELAKTIVDHFGPGKTTKPLVVVEFGGKYPDDRTIRYALKEKGIPVFDGAEDAIRAISKLCKYQDYLKQQNAMPQKQMMPTIHSRAIHSILTGVASKGRSTLTEIEGYDVFNLCGIQTPSYKLTQQGKDAADFVERLLKEKPRRFVAKVVSPDIIHKTDVGGVSLNIKTPEQAQQVVEEMNAKFSKQSIDYHGIMISEMVPSGLEMMIGANRDPTFGPITVSGLGGVMVEVLKDVVFNMCPVSVEEAELSLQRMKHKELLEGYRGKPKLNRRQFAQFTSSVSLLMSTFPSIAEIDVNPLIQSPEGKLTAVDSVIKIKNHLHVCSNVYNQTMHK